MHNRAACSESGTDLVQREHQGEVERGDRADDADGLANLDAAARKAGRNDLAQVLLELIGLRQVDPEAKRVDRFVQLRHVGQGDRRAGLGDDHPAELLAHLLQRRLQLLEAARAQVAVGRPVRRVERAARGSDGTRHIVDGRVRGDAEHLFGRRIDVVERRAVGGVDELAVDQHPGLTLGCRHVNPSRYEALST